ncbi:MAG TPA: twin-arginine translocase subunit TatC [Phycisphaerae bacterium]|nr:twin-arginine translocase subunit TatC [Phycisphaerae bacterium]
MAKHRVQRVADEESEEGQSRMSFGEHLEELRKRIVRALLLAVIGVGLCMFYVHEIYNIVTRPYHVAAQAAGVQDVLITLKPQEVFFTPISLAVKAGLILTSPWIIYQLWQFVGAGLYKRERRIVYRYIGPSALLFLLGVAFFYFIVLPMTLQFFFSFASHGGTRAANPNFWDRIMMHFTPEMSVPVGASNATATAAATAATATANATATAPAGTATAPAETSTAPATLPAGPMVIPSIDHDPEPPPEGQVLLYYHSLEHRMKIMLHDRTMIPTVVIEGAMFINSWRADDYLDFVGFTALIFGIAFQLPMVILILAQIDIVQTQTFRNVRKFAYFGILIAAVIVAPSGDAMTLAFLFVPLVLLYEVGIILAAIATRGRPQDD